MSKKTFKQRVQAMSAREIIMAMVRGLEAQHVRVDMDTFGQFRKIEGKPVCFGCAATNTICEIAGRVPEFAKSDAEDMEIFNSAEARMEKVARTWDASFIRGFELALNWLRQGNIDMYNYQASGAGIANIIKPSTFGDLPLLTTDSYKENLHWYVELAEAQDNAE